MKPSVGYLPIILTIGFFGCQALECGVHITSNEQLKQTISKCTKTNKTFEGLWDMTSSESSSSSEEQPAGVDGKMLQIFRNRRDVLQETTTAEPDATTMEPNQTSSEVVPDNCILQCIFQNLDVTDSEGFPQHDKIRDGLVREALGRELTDFLSDITDECYQEIDQDAPEDSCAYSVKLVECLANKGKANCSDWPIGDLPFHL